MKICMPGLKGWGDDKPSFSVVSFSVRVTRCTLGTTGTRVIVGVKASILFWGALGDGVPG